MLNTLKSPKTKQKSVQVGRGIGSKSGGHTAGRGQKGQKSRSGYSRPRAFFEGGSNSLIKRLPKLKGFSRVALRIKYNYVNISLTKLNTLKDGQEVTMDNLVELGLIHSSSKTIKAKILANGKIEKKVNIKGVHVTQSAKDQILKAGGTIN